LVFNLKFITRQSTKAGCIIQPTGLSKLRFWLILDKTVMVIFTNNLNKLMFKGESTKNSGTIETIIGPSVKVEGDFIGEGDVIVEGIVIGNLKTKNNLKVMSSAKIQAEIVAKSAFVAGEILGNMNIDADLEITASAKIKGDIIASLISIEKGALVNGKITMQKNQPPANLGKEEKIK